MKYLHSVEKAAVLRHSGFVLTLSKVVLKQEVESNIGQWLQQMIVVDCNNYGVAHSSQIQRGDNFESRRQRQRLKQECLRDQRIG